MLNEINLERINGERKNNIERNEEIEMIKLINRKNYLLEIENEKFESGKDFDFAIRLYIEELFRDILINEKGYKEEKAYDISYDAYCCWDDMLSENVFSYNQSDKQLKDFLEFYLKQKKKVC